MMSVGGNILFEAGRRLEDVRMELGKLAGAFDRMWAPGDLPRGTRARVDSLVEDLEQFSGMIEDACDYIAGDWQIIENNMARLSEVREFLKSYKSFRDEALRLDDLCSVDVCRDDEVFADSSVVMELMLMVAQFDSRLEFADEFLSKAKEPKEVRTAKYQGLCDKLYTFMYGVSPQVMEAFLDRDEMPLLKGTWIGSKRDATYFGHHFGKECVQMNTIFNFSTDDGKAAKLNYSQNDDKGVKPSDPIAMILRDYPVKK